MACRSRSTLRKQRVREPADERFVVARAVHALLDSRNSRKIDRLARRAERRSCSCMRNCSVVRTFPGHSRGPRSPSRQPAAGVSALFDHTNTWGTSRIGSFASAAAARRARAQIVALAHAAARTRPAVRPRRAGSAAASRRAPPSRPPSRACASSSAVPPRAGGRERGEPALAHRLEHPQPEVVGEADRRQAVALGQVIEREEIEEGKVAKDVDDRAARRGLARRGKPRTRRPRCARRSADRRTQAADWARTLVKAPDHPS